MKLNRRAALTLFTASPIAYIAAQPAWAAAEPAVYSENGVAIDGTDPVAYFTQGAPIAGDPDITFAWQGTTWRFANVENRDLFAAAPEDYAPQYGGYCAYAVSEGYTASTVPEALEDRRWKTLP